MDLGLVIPPVRTRDNIDLPGNAYVIRVHGVPVAQGEAPAGMVLVLGERPAGLPGQSTIDPVFGMEATWVPAEMATQAERSEEHTSELQSLMRISYAVFCLKKKIQ